MRIRGHQVGRRSILTTGLAASAGVLITAGAVTATGTGSDVSAPPPTEVRSLAETSNPTGAATREPVEQVEEPVVLEPGPLGIPGVAMDAYHRAAHILAEEQPGCAMPWSLLAGIGQVESEHGYGRLDDEGWTEGRVLGPRLDGTIPGTAVIRDSDEGRFDGDREYDRAVGPMQFIPQTWNQVGREARGGEEADPNNIYDAALSSATLLCNSGGAMDDPSARDAAIFSYNASEAYVQNVNAWAAGFLTNTFPDPADLPPIHDARPEVDDSDDCVDEAEATGEAQSEDARECEPPEDEKPEPTPPPEPEPEPTPEPEPSPTPEPEQSTEPAPSPAPEPFPGLPLPEIDLCPPFCGP